MYLELYVYLVFFTYIFDYMLRKQPYIWACFMSDLEYVNLPLTFIYRLSKLVQLIPILIRLIYNICNSSIVNWELNIVLTCRLEGGARISLSCGRKLMTHWATLELVVWNHALLAYAFLIAYIHVINVELNLKTELEIKSCPPIYIVRLPWIDDLWVTKLISFITY